MSNCAPPRMRLDARRSARKVARRTGTGVSIRHDGKLMVVTPDDLDQLDDADESRPWMRHAGMVESAAPNSSRKIDDVIYGRKP